jgi:transposase
MPSLTPKIIGGHTYDYVRYCQRVDGKPKIVRQVYLGKIDDLVAAAERSQQPPLPLETEVAAFGDAAALFDIAQRLDLVQLLDSFLPVKRHQGLSSGHYLLLAAINRAVSPTSKLQFSDWYRQTVLTRLLPADAAALSSQNFWNHMDLVSAEHVLECEKQITQRLIQRFQLDLRALVYDGTNFFTYINTRTPAELPQRGHNKQKRGDLRQVSLGLLVSADFHIPLFHKVYAGNVNDSTEFRSIEELSTHYRQLAESCDHITLVFDKGNNSEEAFESLRNTPFHFVGSLVPSQHSELLAISRKQFRTLTQAGLEGVEAHRTQKKVFGQPRTIVVTFNRNLYDGQIQGLTAHLGKARRKLRDLQTQLQRRRDGKVKGGKAPTLDSVKKQIHTICSAQFVEKILQAEVQRVRKGLELTFRTDQAALDRLCRVQFGKTILFTDNADWSEEQIVLAYRSQYHIEDAFKQMKNPHFLGWSPMFHWTGSKIQVHAFYCVLALLLTSLLQRDLAQKGEPLSINRMLEELGGIRETLVVYPRRQGQRQASTATCLTRMTALQQRLFSLLSLQRFVPASS